MVMPFSLIKAPATFQDMINHILKDFLNEGIMVYTDNILIYAKMEEKHDLLIKEVLKRLAENDFVMALEKCIWSSD
jgi:transcriptional regulator